MESTLHAEIEEQGWIARYLAGRLPPEQADALEQHLLSCRECQDRMEVEETLRDGVRAWSLEQAARQTAVRAGLLAWLAHRGRSRRLAFALTLLLVAALPGGLVLRQAARLRGELAQARAADGAAAGRIARLEGQLAAERLAAGRAAAGERRERGDRERLARELELERQPRVDTQMVTLSPLRSGGEGAPPVLRIALPARAPTGSARPTAWIALALELDGPRHPAYAATLSKAGRGAIWRGEGLHPNASDALTLSLPASLLAPGDYEIRVEGLAAGSPPVPAGRFPFRAVEGR